MGSKGRTKTPTQNQIDERDQKRSIIRERLDTMPATMLDMRNHELRIRAIEAQLGIPSPPLRSLKRRLIQRGDDDYA